MSSPVAGVDRRIRVLAVCPQLTSGGAERQLVCLCRHLDRGRFDLRVVYYESAGPLLEELRGLDVAVVHLDRRRLGAVGLLRALRREVAAWQPDVLDCRLPSGYRFGRLAAIGNTAAVVIAEERTECRAAGVRRLVDRWLNRWTDAWIGNSKVVAAHIVRDLGMPADRVHVIYNGIDVERFRSTAEDPDLADLRRQGRRIVLNLGNLSPAKNQKMFLRVADRLRREHADLAFALCGQGPLREPLEACARGLGLAGVCRFLGFRQDVAPVLAAAALVIQSSDWEGLPNAVMEAMAAGAPVVATAAGGTAELIEDGVNGFLLPVGDEEGVAARASAVLADGVLARRLGDAAAETIRLKFSAPAMARQYEDLFVRLLAEKGR
jgi:glycosyltransferase involved in cell wall biosynthesis